MSRYARNRMLRIVPVYWAILAVTIAAAVAVVSVGPTVFGRPSAATTTADALLVHGFAPATFSTGIGPAWSLVTEATFYVLLPLLGLLAVAAARRGAGTWPAFAPVAAMVVLAAVGFVVVDQLVPGKARSFTPEMHSVLERSILGTAALFAFGMAVAVARVHWEDGKLRLGVRARRALKAIVLLGGAIVLLYQPHGTLAYAHEPAIAAVGAILLALLVLPPERPSRLVALFDHPMAVTVGVVSYSVFLWNFPLENWLRRHELTASGAAGLVPNFAVLLALTLALSVASYRLVERPALRYRRTQTRVPAAQVEAAP